jgi:hypothetical protein
MKNMVVAYFIEGLCNELVKGDLITLSIMVIIF